MSKDTEQLERIKAGLKCSDEEAADVLAYDKAIDHGEATPHDLTPAQNKIAQSYAHTGTRNPPFTNSHPANANRTSRNAKLFKFWWMRSPPSATAWKSPTQSDSLTSTFTE